VTVLPVVSFAVGAAAGAREGWLLCAASFLGEGSGTGTDCAVAMVGAENIVTPPSTIAPKIRIAVSD
jgi:uncharacterized spore protein YtfJ